MRSSDELGVSIDGEKLETDSIQYPGTTMSEDARSVQELKARIAIATSSLSSSKRKTIWREKNISMKT